MPRLMNEHDSTERHINLTRRHQRLCRQFKGAEGYALGIQPDLDAVLAAFQVSEDKALARHQARDSLILAEKDSDNQIRTTFEGCAQWDRTAPGDRALDTVFPEGRFGTVIAMANRPKAAAMETLALRLEKFPAEHPLHALATGLRDKAGALLGAEAGDEEAQRQQAGSDAALEIAKAQLRRHYEANYLDSRKVFGKLAVERLFPILMTSHASKGSDTGTPGASAPTSSSQPA